MVKCLEQQGSRWPSAIPAPPSVPLRYAGRQFHPPHSGAHGTKTRPMPPAIYARISRPRGGVHRHLRPRCHQPADRHRLRVYGFHSSGGYHRSGAQRFAGSRRLSGRRTSLAPPPPFTKHSYIVKQAEDIPAVFNEAFYIAASGRPGPVLIDIPVDMQQAEISDILPHGRPDIIGYKPQVKGHPLQVRKAAKTLRGKRPAYHLRRRWGLFRQSAADVRGLCRAVPHPCDLHHDGHRRSALRPSSEPGHAGFPRLCPGQ